MKVEEGEGGGREVRERGVKGERSEGRERKRSE